MARKRIHEWSKDNNLQSAEVLQTLKTLGFEKNNVFAYMPEELMDSVLKKLTGASTKSAKPAATTETRPAKQDKVPVNKPADKPVDKPAVKPAEPAKNIQQPSQQKPVQQQQQKPVQQQQQKPVQQQQQKNNNSTNIQQKHGNYDEYDENDAMRGGRFSAKQDKGHHTAGTRDSYENNKHGNRDNRDNRDNRFHNDRDNRFRNDRDNRNQKDKHQREDNNRQQDTIVQEGEEREVHMKSPIVVKAFADAIGRRVNEVIQELMAINVLASINMTIDTEVAIKVARKFGVKLTIDKRDKELHQAMQEEEVKSAPEDRVYENKESELAERPPIVTFMGHVDHGKTSLQDTIRKTHVTNTESGGITQHIGASVVSINGKSITFVDTPGHEAFSQMRARGANITDIVVLVVAADDGFMPQTIEAMNHAKAAGVPIIVAVNKMDLPEADYDRVLLNMQQHDLGAEDWGGSVAAIKVSARTGMGIPDLLERILLEAEMLELKSNPKNPGQAYVLESELEQGFGPTASIVVKNGTVRVGDVVICGQYFGRIRTLLDSRGKRIQSVGPGMPAKVVGLSGVPAAGMKLAVCDSLAEAKQLAEERKAADREEELGDQKGGATLADIFGAMEDEKRNDLKVIIKTDVSGSTEAIKGSLEKLPSDKIKIDILHADVGAITGTDVNLASTSGAIIIGFHVRVNPGVNEQAKKAKVEIRLYSIIYELLEDITDALAGRLEPEKREKDIGTVRIKQIFHLSNGMDICGCIVEKGIAKVGTKARVIRNKEIIFNGEVRSLRHLKDDVREVRAGMECGIRLDNFADFTEGDIIQLYDIELKKQTL